MSKTKTEELERELNEARQKAGDAEIQALPGMGNWEQWQQDGLVCRITIKRYRGKTRLKPSDVGLSNELLTNQDLAGLFTLGQKHMLPENIIKHLDNIEGQMRAALDRWGFAGVMGAVFVPFNNYAKLKRRIERLTARYYGQRNGIEYSYDRIKAEMTERYTTLARQTYEELRAKEAAGAEIELTDEETFVTKYVANVMNHFPDKSKIRSSFDVIFEARFMPKPLTVEKALAEARSAAIARQLDTGRLNVELKKMKAQEAYYERQAAAHMTAQEFYLSSLREATDDALRTMQADLDRTVSDFPKLIQDRLLNTLMAGCNDILVAIQTKDKVTDGNLRSLRKLITSLDELNFIGHPTVEAAVARIEGELNARGIKGNRGNAAGLEAVLADIGMIVRSELTELQIAPRTKRDLIIPQVEPEKLEDVRKRVFLLDDEPATDLFTFAGRRQAALLEE